MNSFFLPAFVCMLLSFSVTLGAAAATQGPDQPTPDATAAATITFQEFFTLPVGPYGLEPTARLLALQGRKVRVSGYVAAEQEPVPGLLLLAPVPVTLSEREDGPADDLPGSTLFVHLPVGAESPRSQAGPVELTGRLELGAMEETDGRISYVRLYVGETPDQSTVQASAALPH